MVIYASVLAFQFKQLFFKLDETLAQVLHLSIYDVEYHDLYVGLHMLMCF